MAATTWNPVGKYSNVTLSNSNKTATGLYGVGSPQTCRATNAHTSGKWYFEVHIDTTVSTNHIVSVEDGTVGASAFDTVGYSDAKGISFRADGYVFFNSNGGAPPNIGGWVAGDVIGVAVDCGTGRVWFAKNGTFNGNPVAGTGGFLSAISTGNFYPFYGPARSDAATGRWATADLSYTPPTGFTTWDGAAGNTWQLTSSVGASWGETATLSWTRGLVSSVAAVFSEAASLSRTRGLVSSASAIFSESSALGRLRPVGASSVGSVFGEASSLGRTRGLASAVGALFGEASALSRKRGLGSSAGSTWSASASFASIKLIGQSVVAAAFSATAAINRIRGLVSSTASKGGEASSLSRVRGLVAASGYVTSQSSSLSRKRGFQAAGNMVYGQGSMLSRKRGLTAGGVAQYGQASQFGGKVFPTPASRSFVVVTISRAVSVAPSVRTVSVSPHVRALSAGQE